MLEKSTSLRLSESTWTDLNAMRKIGESFDDILKRLIKDEIEYLKITEPNATRLSEAY